MAVFSPSCSTNGVVPFSSELKYIIIIQFRQERYNPISYCKKWDSSQVRHISCTILWDIIVQGHFAPTAPPNWRPEAAGHADISTPVRSVAGGKRLYEIRSEAVMLTYFRVSGLAQWDRFRTSIEPLQNPCNGTLGGLEPL